MDISFTPHGWEDLEYWKDNDLDKVRRIINLIKSIREDPFRGLGKPEPLRGSLSGWWSRRITEEHRIVYRVSGTRGVDQKCVILQCRFHYDY